MKIADVRTHLLCHELDAPFQSAFSQFDTRLHCLVEIVCEDGTTGWGECLGPARPNAAIVSAMRPLLLGRDPLKIEQLWLTLYNQFRDQGQRGLAVSAQSGIDIALWDIAGKHYGAPVHALMGGAFRSSVRAYATGGFRRLSGDRPSYLAEETAAYVAQGFTGVKIKIGYGLDDDLATIAAVREAIGPETTFMIDANHGYDPIEAIRLGNAAAGYGIEWFEEPVVPEDLAGYLDIRRGQPIPIAGGETWYTRWTMRDVFATRAVDIVQPDVCGVGGLSEARKIADMAACFGVRLVPHVWGTAVALAAGLHYLAILPPTPPRHEERQFWFEFDQTENPFRQAVVRTPILASDGIVQVPDGPGLGIEIDRAALERFAPAADTGKAQPENRP
jgi:D-galactarolactone cycloisomerase